MIEIYTLKALAAKEGVSYDHLRHLVAHMKAGNIDNVWRGYELIQPGRSYWIACKSSEKIVFYDSPM